MNTWLRKSLLCTVCVLTFMMPCAAFWQDRVQAFSEESLLTSSMGHVPVAQTIEERTVADVMVRFPLCASDPDGDTITLKLIDQPRLGTAVLDNGSLIYTPAANRTGTDHFSYCAVDTLGNESDPARISVKIERNPSAVTYADMTHNPNHLAAVRLAQKGIFLGEKIGTSYFLHPNQPMTRSEFIAMTAAAADLDITQTTCTDFQDDSALSPWAKPYISAAAGAGLIQGYQTASGSAEIRGENPITISEASVIVSHLLDTIPAEGTVSYQAVPAWAADATRQLAQADILPTTSDFNLNAPVTRELACTMLYKILK
ncbi:MAG: S-layer homology domain-containing protein [Butyricicoccus pullicaecorum]|nr:S-layer homology domain-containing protein [Butyricicoccus pullicaecorum]